MLPVIYGCKSDILSNEEEIFFKKTQPLGFILFERNCKNPDQLKNLINHLKSTLNHKEIPILIDQEGGRVVRLKPPFWKARPAAKNLKSAIEVYNNAVCMAKELKELGINVNCAPCADLLIDGADEIIGDRAFSKDPEIVSEFSIAMLKGFEDEGITAVIKHLPGHGRAPVDSHEELPIVTTELNELKQTDFLPFKNLSKKSTKAWGMTAHVIYSAIDKENVATHSTTIINEIIRKEIGFNGFLVSDCLTMKALSGTFEEKAFKSIKAGCNAVLMCNGSLKEYQSVADGIKKAIEN